MSIGKTQLQRTVVGFLLSGALVLLAGCGGGGGDSQAASSGSSGSSDAPAAQPTKAGLPTMPSARFAAPTTMITPQSSEPKVEATATLTATEEMSETEELTATEEVTSTEEVTE